MLFKIVSFHPASDGSVEPKLPTFIDAVTIFNAKHLAAQHLDVPEDTVTIEAYEGDIPGGSVVLDDRPLTHGRKMSGTHVFLI